MAITMMMTDSFMPPSTNYGGIPTSSTNLGDDVTALALCDDGTMLAVLCLDFERFLTWLKTDSLFQRIEKLKQRSEWAYVFMVGSARPNAAGKAVVNGNERNWSWASIQGALVSMQELGIIVGYCADEAQFGEAVVQLGNRQRTTKRMKSLRNFETYSPAEEMLLALPGVGEKTMLELIRECGTVMWALIALTAPDTKVAGIGDKSKAAIRNALGLEDDEQIMLGLVDGSWKPVAKGTYTRKAS